MAGMGGGTNGVTVTPPTPEELRQQCVHAWRDISQDGTAITQACVRCNATRTISVQ